MFLHHFIASRNLNFSVIYHFQHAVNFFDSVKLAAVPITRPHKRASELIALGKLNMMNLNARIPKASGRVDWILTNSG